MEPKGIECYSLSASVELYFPFSKSLFAQLEPLKSVFVDDTFRLEEDEENTDKDGNPTESVRDDQMERLRSTADFLLGGTEVTEVMKKYPKDCKPLVF